MPNNNNIKDFESADNIISYLREQFAGLQKKIVNDVEINKNIKENKINKEEKTSFVKENDEESEEENIEKEITQTEEKLLVVNEKLTEDKLKEIIKTSHPIIGELKKYLNIKYKFYIEDFNDLKNLLSARSFREADNNKKEYIFTRYYQEDGESDKLFIDKSIFDNNMKLKLYRPAEWKEDFISFKREKIEDNLPF